MDEWDEEKLDEVIKKKHGSEKSNATDIVSFIFQYTSRVILPLKDSTFSNLHCTQYSIYFQICKHFLEAVENSKYGWFWNCPIESGGQECKYRHALPVGYVLKKVGLAIISI